LDSFHSNEFSLAVDDSHPKGLGQRVSSRELFFFMGLDDAVLLGIGNTGKNVARFDLLIIQEGLIGLINATRDESANTGGASPRPTRIGKIQTSLFGGL
jgi:hypothetical protein